METARRFILVVQGLDNQQSCNTITEIVNRVHNVQIDTISVVSRSHNLILFSRFNDYQEGEVWELEKSGKLFEYWSHAMCLVPMSEFPYYAWKMEQYQKSTKGWLVGWGHKNKDIVEEVYKHVSKEGPTRSSDFKREGKKTEGWWDWKVEKRALEYLFTVGRLMVAYREGFQKHYDITERVVPPGTDTEPMDEDEILDYAILTTLRSLGIADAKVMKTYTGRMVFTKTIGGRITTIEKYLSGLIDSGKIIEVCIPGIDNKYYSLPEFERQLQTQVEVSDSPMKFLSPFDNLVRDRDFPLDLWNFEYKLEAYTPKTDREYGYYVLPILDVVSGRIVGRADMKCYRKDSLLEIKSLFIESTLFEEKDVLDRFHSGLLKFARFHNCKEIRLVSIRPTKYEVALRGLL